jgi:type IV pilus assembly protein PilY1
LQGNLWRFDVSGGSSTWTGSSKAKVLFLARTAAGAAQPITVIPAVSLNPTSGYQVSFGTGKFLEPSDSLAASAQQQSMYNIWDKGDGITVQRASTGSGSNSVNGLITRTLTISTSTISITGNAFNYGTISGTYRGWYVDMSNTMERIAVDPAFQSGVLAINSTIPGDACVSTGSANQYRVNAFTGNSLQTTSVNSTTGYLGSASILLAGESAWSARTSGGRYVVTRKLNTLSAGTSGSVSDSETTVNVIGGRISWREISNF